MMLYVSSFFGDDLLIFSSYCIVVLGILALAFLYVSKHNHLCRMQIEAAEVHKMQEQLTLERERYRVAAEISNDIVFDYDFSNDLLILSDKFRQLCGRPPVIEHFSGNFFLNLQMVHPDDRELFRESCIKVAKGVEGIDIDLRIQDITGEYIWFQYLAKTIKDDKKKMLRVIGRLTNVDLFKKEMDRLQAMAQQDPLTGVFNKTVTKISIDRGIFLKSKMTHLMMFVDVDNFKTINDTYGHNLGDKILINMINRLRGAVRNNDIIGRIGGDEFIIFMSEIDDDAAAQERLHEIRNLLQYEYEQDGTRLTMTASVGAAVYPLNGKNYSELIAYADKEMYKHKESRKGSLILFRA